MFCEKCGASIPEDGRFCRKCGSQIRESVHTAQAAVPHVDSLEQDQENKEKKAGFFYSPGGIVLMVVIGLAVLGGLTIGAIFLFRGDSYNTIDAATMDVWEEYAKISESDGEKIARIDMNPDNLNQAKADLEASLKKLEGLQKVAVETTGSNAKKTGKRKPPPPDSVADDKSEELMEIIKIYQDYIDRMSDFLGTLVIAIIDKQLTNPDVITNLNNILAELQKLAKIVKDATGTFLDPKTTEILVDRFPDFNPGEILENQVFQMAQDLAPQVEQSVAEAQAEEAAVLEAERQAAEQAAAEEAARQAAQEKTPSSTWSDPNEDGYWDEVTND